MSATDELQKRIAEQMEFVLSQTPEALAAENAKLRRLATLNWEWAHTCCGDGCRLSTEYCGYAIDRECNYEREIHDLMVELGVDDA